MILVPFSFFLSFFRFRLFFFFFSGHPEEEASKLVLNSQ